MKRSSALEQSSIMSIDSPSMQNQTPMQQHDQRQIQTHSSKTQAQTPATQQACLRDRINKQLAAVMQIISLETYLRTPAILPTRGSSTTHQTALTPVHPSSLAAQTPGLETGGSAAPAVRVEAVEDVVIIITLTAAAEVVVAEHEVEVEVEVWQADRQGIETTMRRRIETGREAGEWRMRTRSLTSLRTLEPLASVRCASIEEILGHCRLLMAVDNPR
jgi:hypothetical protein